MLERARDQAIRDMAAIHAITGDPAVLEPTKITVKSAPACGLRVTPDGAAHHSGL